MTGAETKNSTAPAGPQVGSGSETDNPIFLPRGFESGMTGYAGACDFIHKHFGLRGWALNFDAIGQPLLIEAVCGGAILARSFAMLPRPDIDGVIGRPSFSSFLVGWSRFDLALVEQLAQIAPARPVLCRVPRADAFLENFGSPFTISQLRDALRSSTQGDWDTEFAPLNDYIDAERSGLFDATWYAAEYAELLQAHSDPLLDYLSTGEAAGRQPNPYFEPETYARARALSHAQGAFVQYCRVGFAKVADPSIHFDTQWYRTEYGLPADSNALAHFLANRSTARPNPCFDPGYYLNQLRSAEAPFADAAAADPYLHYLRIGETLGLAPSASFAPEFYRARYLNGQAAGSALGHFLAVGRSAGLAPNAEAARQTATNLVPATMASGALSDTEFSALITAYGLFDATLYVAENPDIAQTGLDPLKHFAGHGDREGRRPNRLFDPVWYAKKYFKHSPAAGPFRDYVLVGEREGRKPCAVFDPAWYGSQYGLEPVRTSLLGHYLAHAAGNTVSPNAYFDVHYYLKNYPDIKEACIDGFEHWYSWGINEDRRASPNFDAGFVQARYLNNDRSRNAFQIFMDIGLDLGWQGVLPAEEMTVPRQIRANVRPGPLFEALQSGPGLESLPAKVFTFYLPQFHPIAENDAWWGTGFTEWRNLPRGVPRFRDHYQPRIPRDLGFYQLQGTEVMRRQIELARSMGVHGFCFYYYNFNGQRLLEKPLDAFVEDPGIDFPFSILWANENWTRRWDGMEKDVLIGQDYRAEDRDALIDDLARYLTRPNYQRVQGRPVLYLYRADIIPDCAAVLESWRSCFRERHGIDPLFVVAQAFGVVDPRPYGFDGALEFPPHKLTSDLPRLNAEIEILDPDFSGQVFDYNVIVDHSLGDVSDEYPLIKTATTGWDNDPRKQGSGLCLHKATPQAFERWMRGLVANARRNRFFGEPVVFVNAWNEWCEGAYLEPDCHFGYAYLNALSRSLSCTVASRRAEKILLVGHDGFPAGAQQLLLNIGMTMASRFGIEIAFILLDSGEMTECYREVAPTYCAREAKDYWGDLAAHIGRLRARGFELALTNTVVSGAAATILAEHEFRICSLIHEMPTIIAENHLADSYRQIRDHSHTVVFPSTTVRDAVNAALGAPSGAVQVQPQGMYKQMAVPAGARHAVRRELGLKGSDRIVLNVGYADLRKGIDLFVNAAKAVGAAQSDIHFLWVGNLAPAVGPWVRHDVERGALRNLHFVPFTTDVARYFGAADLFFLTSREDPFPSVVMEALACGVPVIAFDQGGGYVDLLRDPTRGRLVPYLDTTTAAAEIQRMLADSEQHSPRRQATRATHMASAFDFATYCADLVGVLNPNRKRVSVVVPNYNYARYMADRLQSIFDQTYSVHEIIVLDDASTDNSVAAIEQVVAASGRVVKLCVNQANSGNVFRQWKAGLDQATGDYIWIAEADDLADPTFLERLIARLEKAPDALCAFSDSVALDAEGGTLYDSYKGYYAQHGDTGLAEDGSFSAHEFLRRFLAVRNLILNASSLVWRTAHLRRVFASLGDEAFRFTCAGDWRIYVEACRLGGSVLYCADTLNRHRRHATSVTHALDKLAHRDEITAVQEVVLRQFPGDASLAVEIAESQRSLSLAWSLDPPAVPPRIQTAA